MIYTAITGGKDTPRDDVHTFSEYDRFIHPRLNAKIYKVLPHLFMDTEWSIWVDGNLFLTVPAEDLLEQMGDKEVLVCRHPHRDCVYEEAHVCSVQGLDDPQILQEQVERYKADGFPEHAGMGACGMIVRKHTPEVARLNEQWWAEITRGSQRDQISFPYVYRDAVKYIDGFDVIFKRRGHSVRTTKET